MKPQQRSLQWLRQADDLVVWSDRLSLEASDESNMMLALLLEEASLKAREMAILYTRLGLSIRGQL